MGSVPQCISVIRSSNCRYFSGALWILPSSQSPLDLAVSLRAIALNAWAIHERARGTSKQSLPLVRSSSGHRLLSGTTTHYVLSFAICLPFSYGLSLSAASEDTIILIQCPTFRRVPGDAGT